MLSINDTVTEMVQWVFPEHAGAPGQIHGGRMMQWIATVGNMAAARVARGHCLLGAMDDIDFLHPVKVGEITALRAQVEAIGRCSMEVGVQVFAENLASGLRTQTLNSHLVFVKVDEHLKPTAVPTTLAPRGAAEDTIFGNTMFPGKLLMDIDEAGGILSMRYIRGHVMTACVDALDFYAPISTHEVVTFKAALNYVGSSSLEVGVKVLTEVPWSGEVRHACTAYLTFVHLGPDLRPRPCPRFVPETPGEKRRWVEAEERRARRLDRVKRLKASIQEGR